MIKLIGCMAVVAFLSGCASNNYMLYNDKYSGEDAFLVAVNTDRTENLATIKPLPAPLTEKKLIVILPSVKAFRAENTNRYNKVNTRNASPQDIKMIDTLALANQKLIRANFEAIDKRGIYKSVEIKDVDSMTTSAEPSELYDVMYYTEADSHSAQTFYSSVKHGKQVFAFDRSGATPALKVQAFVEAAQAMAIRN